MRKFKIRKIDDQPHRFDVEVEFLDNQDREGFGFPKNQGWRNIVNGEEKFIDNIRQQVKMKYPDVSAKVEKKKTDTINKKYVGTEISADTPDVTGK